LQVSRGTFASDTLSEGPSCRRGVGEDLRAENQGGPGERQAKQDEEDGAAVERTFEADEMVRHWTNPFPETIRAARHPIWTVFR